MGFLRGVRGGNELVVFGWKREGNLATKMEVGDLFHFFSIEGSGRRHD